MGRLTTTSRARNNRLKNVPNAVAARMHITSLVRALDAGEAYKVILQNMVALRDSLSLMQMKDLLESQAIEMDMRKYRPPMEALASRNILDKQNVGSAKSPMFQFRGAVRHSLRLAFADNLLRPKDRDALEILKSGLETFDLSFPKEAGKELTYFRESSIGEPHAEAAEDGTTDMAMSNLSETELPPRKPLVDPFTPEQAQEILRLFALCDGNQEKIAYLYAAIPGLTLSLLMRWEEMYGKKKNFRTSYAKILAAASR